VNDVLKSDLIAQYRRESRDSASPYFTSDTELVGLFNDAVSEATQRKNLLFDASTAAVCQIAVTALLGSTYAINSAINNIAKAYLIDASGLYTYLTITSREKLDDINPTWREDTGIPGYIIVEEGNVTITPAPLVSYTMKLEVYRSPLSTELLVTTADTSPVIALSHHRKLYHWPMYIVHGTQDDEDTYNPERASRNLREFEKYFGFSPGSGRKRDTRLPQVNKLW